MNTKLALQRHIPFDSFYINIVTIYLPKSLKKFIDTSVDSFGVGTNRKYMGELIRNAPNRHLPQRESQRQQLRDQILAGAMSCATTPVTPAYFHGLRERILTTRPQRIN